MRVLNDPKLEAFLDALHAQSDGENGAINAYFQRRIQEGTLSWDGFDPETTAFFRDKMVALEKVKAEYCYALCRALNAKRIVECGTSYGVSTLYLAAAVRDNIASSGVAVGDERIASSSVAVGDERIASSSVAVGDERIASSRDGDRNNPGGTVIATEHEPSKAKIARRNFEAAGLTRFIDLREGDLADTLKNIEEPVDFVLLDIWTEAVMPAVRNIAPHLHPGSVLVADNSAQSRRGYAAYFDYIADPANRLVTMTLPFEGGLEMTVRI